MIGAATFQHLAALHGLFLIGDDPMTCPRCGCRTEWDDVIESPPEPGAQVHECKNTRCGFRFAACEDGDA